MHGAGTLRDRRTPGTADLVATAGMPALIPSSLVATLKSMNDSVVRTSDKGWFAALARAYRDRSRILVVDDANVGIDPARESLVAMAIKAHLSIEQWIAVGVSIGVSAAGVTMVVLAFVDPEPTSKLGLLVGGGAVCVLAGGLTAVRILTRLRPPSITASAGGIRISWDESGAENTDQAP